MKQKNNGIKRLLEFTGNKRGVLNLSRILSGISAIFILGPFLCVYFAARDLVDVFTGSPLDTERASYQKEADGCQRRMSELDAILKKLYEDRVFGIISDERYLAMSADFEAESKKVKDRYSELHSLLGTFTKQSHDVKKFAELVEKYTNITDVTEELLHTLVDKIVVHEKEVIDGKIVMRVDIYYRFIGKVGDKDGDALKAPNIRRNTKLLMEAGVLPEHEA